MSNIVPYKTWRIIPQDTPSITKSLTTRLKRINRPYKNYKRHGYREEDRIRLETSREECKIKVEYSKFSYLANLGRKINDTSTTKECSWKINRVMNNRRVSQTPPLNVKNTLVLDSAQKPKLFNDYFSQ